MIKNTTEDKILMIPVDGFDIDNYKKFIKPLKKEKTRDWFSRDFYRCLPLTIGNQQGFAITSPYKFGFYWNGGDDPNDLKIFMSDLDKELSSKEGFKIESHFGHGIITVFLPIIFKTPEGISLMTISPPNFVMPNLTAMTGVIECDNLRTIFTFNLKVNLPDINVSVDKNTPIAGFIAIKRYFQENFSLEPANNYFEKELIEKESELQKKFTEFRSKKSKTNDPFDRLYMNGIDFENNIFKDHQK